MPEVQAPTAPLSAGPSAIGPDGPLKGTPGASGLPTEVEPPFEVDFRSIEPELALESQADVVLTLTLSGAVTYRIEVPPHGQRALRVKIGTYHLRLESTNGVPCEADVIVQVEARWVLTQTKLSSEKLRLAGKGWRCAQL